MERLPGVVLHDVDVLAVERVAAEVLVEDDLLLEHHHELAGLVVGAEEVVRAVHPVDALPAAAGEGLEEGREADVVEDRLPVERIGEVAERRSGRLRCWASTFVRIGLDISDSSVGRIFAGATCNRTADKDAADFARRGVPRKTR